MLILQRKKGQSITIGGNIKITVTDLGNEQVKIAIDAPREISIARTELLEVRQINQEAASASPAAVQSLKGLVKSN